MDNKRAILISLVALLISMLLITAYVRVKRDELTHDFGDEVQVVIAAEPIPEFAVIRPENLTVITVFKNFRQPQTVEKIEDVIGKAAYVPFYKGEQITLTKLVTQDGKPVLDRQVDKKMRAVTLQVYPHTGVGKLIRPGNHVDIMGIPNYDTEGTTVFEVKTLVQNALVLATGKTIQNAVPTRVTREVLNFVEEQAQARSRKDILNNSMEGLSTTRPDDNYTNMTVQLSPEDAEKVLFITQSFSDTRLYFTLRNRADQEVAKLDDVVLDEVLGPDSDYGATKRKPPPPAPPRGPRFYDFRGGDAVPVE